MDGICCQWDSKKPERFLVEDNHTSFDKVDIGGGMYYRTNGVTAFVAGGRTKCFFHVSKSGMHSLHYAVAGGVLYVDTYKWRLMERANFPASIHQVKEGVVYCFTTAGEMKKYKGDDWVPEQHPIIDIDFNTAVSDFMNRLVYAAKDVLSQLPTNKVAALLSGGTDSTLVVWALMQAGAEVECFTVGRSPEDFDPHYAIDYAGQLGVPLTFVPLPEADGELERLLVSTISRIEQCDFSNVLMAMCTSVAMEAAHQKGHTVVFHGHFADDIVGNGILTVGGFKKALIESGGTITAEGWRDWRAKWCMHTISNNTQVDKVARHNGMTWRALFYHPLVYNFVMCLPLDVTPVATDKKLYKAACDTFIQGGAWSSKKKVGYYTGSGIGSIKLQNPILSEGNMREVYNMVKPR
jgi:asparagine synthetase B (glutamine-hydrolysing)